jgi:hypothetical protein
VTRLPYLLALGAISLALAGSLLGVASARAEAILTTLFCGKWAGDEPLEQIQPRQCSTIGPNDSMADGLVYKRLRWRHWGASTATAKGFIQPKTYDTIAVRLRHTGGARSAARTTATPAFERPRSTGAGSSASHLAAPHSPRRGRDQAGIGHHPLAKLSAILTCATTAGTADCRTTPAAARPSPRPRLRFSTLSDAAQLEGGCVT